MKIIRKNKHFASFSLMINCSTSLEVVNAPRISSHVLVLSSKLDIYFEDKDVENVDTT